MRQFEIQALAVATLLMSDSGSPVVTLQNRVEIGPPEDVPEVRLEKDHRPRHERHRERERRMRQMMKQRQK